MLWRPPSRPLYLAVIWFPRAEPGASALESTSEKEEKKPLNQTLDWLKADRNCVVVRRGGEQRKASLSVRTIRNLIRPGVLASLLASGEAERACGRRRETVLRQRPQNARRNEREES